LKRLDKLNALDYILIEHIEYQKNIVSVIGQLDQILESIQCSVGLAHLDLSRLGTFRRLMLEFIKNMISF